ncbi:hypothetical protein QBC45DRAFT_486166 [Copromyces sp. CBS 386.78]|nr:hypothetical protein QBC45DRAFT_486166 [Copromyces sp. CBS 386.78]
MRSARKWASLLISNRLRALALRSVCARFLSRSPLPCANHSGSSRNAEPALHPLSGPSKCWWSSKAMADWMQCP